MKHILGLGISVLHKLWLLIGMRGYTYRGGIGDGGDEEREEDKCGGGAWDIAGSHYGFVGGKSRDLVTSPIVISLVWCLWKRECMMNLPNYPLDRLWHDWLDWIESSNYHWMGQTDFPLS
jgi:hypothetical protein